jgi:hypothetical protein
MPNSTLKMEKKIFINLENPGLHITFSAIISLPD